MRKPLDPKRAKQIGERIKELSKKSDDAGQAAAGEFIRDPEQSHLPFEDNGQGQRTANIPLPDGGVAGISYDPSTPPHTDFDFSVQGPDGQPRNVPGIDGMENGTAKVPPMDIGPAIEKATEASKAVGFATREDIAPATRKTRKRTRE
jgi:hypothetical protein